jgi:HK97 family phage prohead protease
VVRKDLMIDAPERRAVAANEFEMRSGAGDNLTLTGYASVFNRGYDVNGGPASSRGWTEIVTPDAFRRTLSESPHVRLLINHEGLPLASTKSGTLRLSTDTTGLLTEARLDRRDPEVRSLEVKMERGDVDEMSFAFRVKAQRWDGANDELRYLDEVSLHKGDVSIVSFGANPHTSAALRSAMRALARGDLDERQFAELRALLRGPRKRALSPMLDDSSTGFQDDDLDGDGGYSDSLAQAIHDLCRDAGANCSPLSIPDTPYPSRKSRNRNLTVREAEAMSVRRRDNLTLREAEAMRGPRRGEPNSRPRPTSSSATRGHPTRGHETTLAHPGATALE